MAIRIGEDGTIINDDQVISSSGTIIRDDGTIESSNIVSSSAPQRNYVSHVAPVSPLENGGNRQSQMSEERQVPVAQPTQNFYCDNKEHSRLGIRSNGCGRSCERFCA